MPKCYTMTISLTEEQYEIYRQVMEAEGSHEPVQMPGGLAQRLIQGAVGKLLKEWSETLSCDGFVCAGGAHISDGPWVAVTRQYLDRQGNARKKYR